MAAISQATFGDIGGAVSSIFGGIGDLDEASAYGKAGAIERQNAQIAAATGRIQTIQADRQIYQTIGGQQADVAGAGLASSGSALDLLRSSMQQGALTKQLIANQTGLSVNSYTAEADSYEGRQAAAQAGAAGGFLGGLLKLGSAALPFFM